MRILVLLAALVVLAVTVAAVLGRISVGGMGGPSRDLAHLPLPDEPLTDADLAALRFDVVARGYRMSEVDAVIDRLRGELAERDARLHALTAPDDAPRPDGTAGIDLEKDATES